jgi:hypothetical protein
MSPPLAGGRVMPKGWPKNNCAPERLPGDAQMEYRSKTGLDKCAKLS